MTEQTPQQPPPVSDGLSRRTLLILLFVCLLGVALVVYLVVRPGEDEQETIISLVEVETPEEADVNVLQVVDTLETPDVQAVEGQRYKVLVVDAAREGASGIARIGGLVTFVPDTQKGDVVVIEVTRIRRSTADAVVIERLDSGVAVPGRPDRPAPRDRPDRPDSPMVGQIFRGTITDMGREGDGVTHVDGKVVFVEGAELGEHVEFRVVEDMGRFARAEVVSKSAEPFDEPVVRETPVREDAPMVGQIFRGTVEDMGREGDGVIRVDGKVVFVEGAELGEHVEFKVVEELRRFARAEVVSKSPEPFEAEPVSEEGGVDAQPEEEAAEDGSPSNDPVEVGVVYDVMVTEQDRRNPEVDGVTRIDGLVVFVPGTQPDDRVRIRITELRARAADAEVVEILPGEDAGL